jgi:O-antigen ligase
VVKKPAVSLRAAVAGSIGETLAAMREPALFMWAMYLLLVPVYLWASGLPQPGDILIILLAPLALARWNGRLSPPIASVMRALVLFTVYVVIVNVAWSLALNQYAINLKKGFGLSPLFYIYNALVFLIVVVMYQRFGQRLLWFTGKVILYALVLQVGAAFALGGASRATVLFNNPNQLGYYALLSASLLLLLQRRRYVTTLEVAIGGVAASYLALISASKAALGGIGLLVIAGVFVRLRTMIVVAIAFTLVLVVANPMQAAIDRTITRFETDSSASFAEERGYDRILKYPEYWVVGSGEGAYKRFENDTALGDHEIHSSIGTLFFSYGIVGTLLFAAFLWTVIRRTGLRTWLLIIPSLAYGMTHQGLRFTLFWVLLAIVVALREDPS